MTGRAWYLPYPLEGTTTMSTLRERIEDAAHRWDARGRRTGDLWTGWDFLIGYCWLFGPSGRAAGCSPEADEFIRASKACEGARYDALLSTREACASCGTTCRVENLAVCTECRRLACPSCASRQGYGCACGGELVG